MNFHPNRFRFYKNIPSSHPLKYLFHIAICNMLSKQLAELIELSCITRHFVNQNITNLHKIFVEINVFVKTSQFGLDSSAVNYLRETLYA